MHAESAAEVASLTQRLAASEAAAGQLRGDLLAVQASMASIGVVARAAKEAGLPATAAPEGSRSDGKVSKAPGLMLCVVWDDSVQCGVVRCWMVPCGVRVVRVWCVVLCAVRCGAVRCGAVRCGAVRCTQDGQKLAAQQQSWQRSSKAGSAAPKSRQRSDEDRAAQRRRPGGAASKTAQAGRPATHSCTQHN